MYKISVIIPVYNANKYLNNCISSLLLQTFKEFEILLINDGSTDNSFEICKAFSNNYKNIYYYNKKNGGAASARNLGIENAKGEYIAFVDADDTVQPDYLEKLYTSATENNADLVLCDYIKYTRNGKRPSSQPIRSGRYDKRDIISELYPCLIMYDDLEFPPTISNCVCLFKRSMLHEYSIRYPEVRLCEDSYFGSVCLYNANTFVYLKGEYLYNYLYHQTSVSHTTDKSKIASRWQSFIKLNDEYSEYFLGKDYDFDIQIKYNMLYFTLNQLSYIRGQNVSFSALRKEVYNILHNDKVKASFKIFKYPKVSFKLKVVIFMIKHRLALLYCLICR